MTQQTMDQQIEEALNLKSQLGSLDQVAESDMIIRDTSPPVRWSFIYSMQTGERIRVKQHRLVSILEKRLPDGSKAFTTFPEQAPTYRLGETKCFLARGAEERDVIDALNISVGYFCQAEHLANPMAAQIHAEKRHPTRWRMYQEHLSRIERDDDRKRQNDQTAAILRLAEGNTAGRKA